MISMHPGLGCSLIAKEFRKDCLLRSVGAAVVQLRKSKGLSQRELARKVGVGQGIISKLEAPRDGELPRIDVLACIAEELGVTLKITFDAD